ncbi:uncharacterized protein LOC143236368 [Tachypleus tridentatus]|uniref:uncharacterized protein LOC143236368 n=1 Tax=Tachypleus tridentatus TaxID=6853 RepID=UPI003FD000BA
MDCIPVYKAGFTPVDSRLGVSNVITTAVVENPDSQHKYLQNILNDVITGLRQMNGEWKNINVTIIKWPGERTKEYFAFDVPELDDIDAILCAVFCPEEKIIQRYLNTYPIASLFLQLKYCKHDMKPENLIKIYKVEIHRQFPCIMEILSSWIRYITSNTVSTIQNTKAEFQKTKKKCSGTLAKTVKASENIRKHLWNKTLSIVTIVASLTAVYLYERDNSYKIM